MSDQNILEQQIENFKNQLKKNKVKITPQRIEIFKNIIHSKEHPTTEMIYLVTKKDFPKISFNTVYTTLLLFAKIGILFRVEGFGDVLRYDPNQNDHGHFHCVSCGKITDFDYTDNIDHLIPDSIRKKSILQKRFIIEGICADCEKYSTS